MRKYKLLKDLPGIKAGTIFEYQHEDENGNIYQEAGIVPGKYKSTFREKDMTYEWFEEIIEKPKMLKDLRETDIFYFIDEEGIIKEKIYYPNAPIQERIIKSGNYSLTKEQTERELKFRQAKRKIEDWQSLNDNGIINWNDKDEEKHYIGFSNLNKILEQYYNTYLTGALFYFSSEEVCKKAIKELEQEFLFLLRDY